MRIRFEKYTKGHGSGSVAECDLTEKQARGRFEELKHDALCGWAELVAEDDHEGGYMNIIASFDNIRMASMLSTII